MSTPKYEPEQEFVGSLVQEVERKKPEFAWFQFVFKSADYHALLLGVKGGLSAFTRLADTPEVKEDSQGTYEVARKERMTEWYRSAPAKVKKIDAIKSLPTLTMAIRGLWVGDVDELTGLGSFSNCTDEIDGLAVVPLRDPRTLLWLSGRRMVEPDEYFRNYGVKARRAAPSLMLTADELPYYVHIPTRQVTASLKSLADAFGGAVSKSTTSRTPWRIGGGRREGEEEGDKEEKERKGFRVAAISRMPALKEKLDEAGSSRLRHLASNSRRSFELTYSQESGRTDLFIGSETSEDLWQYEDLLSSLYGGVSFSDVDLVPSYIRTLADEFVREAGKKPPRQKARRLRALFRLVKRRTAFLVRWATKEEGTTSRPTTSPATSTS
jgi:hypothetical protein